MDRPEDNSLNSAARETERLLKQFQPVPASLDRDQLMFRAGQAAAHAAIQVANRPAASLSAWLWPASTAAMTGIAACLTFALALQLYHAPNSAQEIVQHQPAAPQAAAGKNLLKDDATPPVVSEQPDVVAKHERRESVPASLALPSGSMLRMRNVALSFGVDALPLGSRSHATALATPSATSTWSELENNEGL